MNGQLDYILFSGASVILFALLQMRARSSRRRRRRLAIGALLLAAILGGGWFLVQQAGVQARAQIEQMVCGYVPTYAQELTRLGHAELTLETEPDDPHYLAMIDAEKRWLAANPSVADIYTFRKRADGKIVVMVDSDTDYNHDGKFDGVREQRTPIGEVYPEVTPFLESAFEGQSGFDEEIVTDRWGTWVSAYMPMRDAAGHIEAVLGRGLRCAQVAAGHSRRAPDHDRLSRGAHRAGERGRRDHRQASRTRCTAWSQRKGSSSRPRNSRNPPAAQKPNFSRT